MSKYIAEKARRTPVLGIYDVVVAGGGPAGVGAALSAARNGAKTCIVEQCGGVGGVATSGMMSHWTGATRGGIYEEILERSAEDKTMRQTINPDVLHSVLLEMLVEAGVEIRLYTFATGPVMRKGAVAGITVESKTGRGALLAKVVVDASGDGDVAARAGARFKLGRDGDRAMQPMTLMFKVAGVDTAKAIFPGSFETLVDVPAGEIQALGRKHIPAPAGHVLLYRTTVPGVVTCNMTNAIKVDGTRAEDLTKAELECRRQIPAIVDFLRKYAPGYENCRVIAAAAQIGVRETRHFAGARTITEDDIYAARAFPDWAVTNAQFNFDIHNVSGAGLDKNGLQAHFRQGKTYTIPYGCLVPARIDGILLAGRMISGTHKAHSSFRAMPNLCADRPGGRRGRGDGREGGRRSARRAGRETPEETARAGNVAAGGLTGRRPRAPSAARRPGGGGAFLI